MHAQNPNWRELGYGHPPLAQARNGSSHTNSGSRSLQSSMHGNHSNSSRPNWRALGYGHPALTPTQNGVPYSGGSSKSSSGSSVQTNARKFAVPPIPSLNGKPDLIDGIDYFKAGEMVEVRRYFEKTSTYSDWLPAKIMRPVLKDLSDGTVERSYEVSYVDPYQQAERTNIFTPSKGELVAIPSDIPDYIPTHPMPSKAIVFAFIGVPFVDKGGKKEMKNMWAPAYLLTVPNPHGVSIRIADGPAAGHEYHNVTHTKTYTPKVAAELREKYMVIGDGVKKYN